MSPECRVRVLDVGQCNLDHANISAFLKRRFDATVDRASSTEQVFRMIGFYDYDLVLVNRIMDADGSEGLDLIRELKNDDESREIPVMLVSNHHDAQQTAIAAGAVPGFGKAALDDPATVDVVAAYICTPD